MLCVKYLFCPDKMVHQVFSTCGKLTCTKGRTAADKQTLTEDSQL